MRSLVARAVGPVLLVLLGSSCATSPAVVATEDPEVAVGSGEPVEAGEPGDQSFPTPPPVVLHGPEDRELPPWSFCYGFGCGDGIPPDQPPAVAVDTVRFGFDHPGWDFSATFRELDRKCPRSITVDAEKTGARSFRLEPVGPAGTWDVDLFGRGPEGDVITTFRWTTPVDGALPGPATGSVAVLADHDGELDSYGVELGIADLGDPRPVEVSATVTVTSVEGRSVTLAPRLRRQCHDAGALFFTAPARQGLAATEIGPGPFDYEVRLVLDGTTYVGRGQWPTGETPDIAPHVPLTWTPALPAYRFGSP